MASWQIAVFSKWTGVGRNDFQVALTYPADWSDLCGQDDAVIKLRSGNYCVLALGRVDDATLAAINADAHYLILARYELDVITPSFDNRQSNVTLAQKNAFVTFFSTEYGIDVSKIPVIANAVGRTRMQVLRDIVVDMRALR